MPFQKIESYFAVLLFALDLETLECYFHTIWTNKNNLCLPMGVRQSSYISQEIMEQVLKDLDELEIQIDDVACFPLVLMIICIKMLDTIFTRLQANGFTINTSKCEWAIQETDWLEYC